jgi:predicted metal-dependent enzyme (double-stranded beta helix superfamily)
VSATALPGAASEAARAASAVDWLALRRPQGRPLTQEELLAFVDGLADRPELWIDLVAHDRAQRVYSELLSDEHLTAWLICWMDEHDTGFHDHDASAGAVAVVSGSVSEERLALGGSPLKRRFVTGSSFSFSPADIHRVRHAGSDPAVTLHVYSPPLLRMGAYAIGADGALRRRSMGYEEELKPPA